jgi:hypothetical protein
MTSRHQCIEIDHTPDIARALRVAGVLWPNEQPATLLAKLIAQGAALIESSEEYTVALRRLQLEAVSGRFSELYPPGYLEVEREGWPE